MAALFAVLVITVVAFLYAPILMSRTNGQTLGRMALGIRVIRADGGPMTFWFALLREVLIKTLLVGVVSSVDVRARLAARRAVAAVGRGEPRAARPRREHARDQDLGGSGGGGFAERGALAAGLGPDDLVAAGADADQRDRDADEVGDVGEVVARGLRQLALVAAGGDVLVPARQLLVLAASRCA